MKLFFLFTFQMVFLWDCLKIIEHLKNLYIILVHGPCLSSLYHSSFSTCTAHFTGMASEEEPGLRQKD